MNSQARSKELQFIRSNARELLGNRNDKRIRNSPSARRHVGERVLAQYGRGGRRGASVDLPAGEHGMKQTGTTGTTEGDVKKQRLQFPPVAIEQH